MLVISSGLGAIIVTNIASIGRRSIGSPPLSPISGDERTVGSDGQPIGALAERLSISISRGVPDGDV